MLILASGSPRRHALLSLMGANFDVQTSDIDESVIPGEPPEEYVLRLAINKSLAFNRLSEKRLVVIAADTAVVDGDHILGKPSSQRDAIGMLTLLRNRTHTVISGLAVRDTAIDEIFTEMCTTRVEMRNYEDREIKDYVASGDPMDKAGAYAIQHSGFNPVAKISGCYANVVGLPLCHLGQIFNRLGLDFQKERIEGCRSSGTYKCQLVENINAMSADNH